MGGYSSMVICRDACCRHARWHDVAVFAFHWTIIRRRIGRCVEPTTMGAFSESKWVNFIFLWWPVCSVDLHLNLLVLQLSFSLQFKVSINFSWLSFALSFLNSLTGILKPAQSPPRCRLPNVTAHPSTASVPTSYCLMWQYNFLCTLKGENFTFWTTTTKFHWNIWQRILVKVIFKDRPYS